MLHQGRGLFKVIFSTDAKVRIPIRAIGKDGCLSPEWLSSEVKRHGIKNSSVNDSEDGKQIA